MFELIALRYDKNFVIYVCMYVSREGIRMVIELKRDAIPAVVQNNLFKKTSLQVYRPHSFLYVCMYVCVCILDNFLRQYVGPDGKRHPAQENISS